MIEAINNGAQYPQWVVPVAVFAVAFIGLLLIALFKRK